MKKLLLLLLLSTSFSAFADVEFDFDLSDFCHKQPGVQERDGRWFFPNEAEGITATSICVYKDAYGQYQSKGKLKNGSTHGYWVAWYENGQKDFEVNFINGEIDTTAIKQYPVQFPISEFFSEKLRSLCDSCDVTDEDYKLTSDDYFDDVDTEMSSYGDEEKTEESKPSLSLVSDNAKLRKI